MRKFRKLLLRIPTVRLAVADFQRRTRAEQKPMLRVIRGGAVRIGLKRSY